MCMPTYYLIPQHFWSHRCKWRMSNVCGSCLFLSHLEKLTNFLYLHGCFINSGGNVVGSSKVNKKFRSADYHYMCNEREYGRTTGYGLIIRSFINFPKFGCVLNLPHWHSLYYWPAKLWKSTLINEITCCVTPIIFILFINRIRWVLCVCQTVNDHKYPKPWNSSVYSVTNNGAIRYVWLWSVNRSGIVPRKICRRISS